MPRIDEGNEFRIAEHRVTEITRETAQVGCTKVTRADVEKLLKNMDAVPKNCDFEITAGSCKGDFLNFSIHRSGGGYISLQDENMGFASEKSFFCLQRRFAEKLLDFLACQLGKNIQVPLYKIEYSDTNGKFWNRSSNKETGGTYPHQEATERAAKEQENMGGGYLYRAVPA